MCFLLLITSSVVHINSYVAEMMANRVLRFFQQPSGVFHASVFYQLSGGVGPSSLALDSAGNLYVGQYDVKGTLCFVYCPSTAHVL